ncbi:MAG: hypothetical protein R3A52_10480 [Polyangiales bacterium]
MDEAPDPSPGWKALMAVDARRFALLVQVTVGLTTLTVVLTLLTLAIGRPAWTVVTAVVAGLTAAAWVPLLHAMSPRKRALRKRYAEWLVAETKAEAAVALIDLLQELPPGEVVLIERFVRDLTRAEGELAAGLVRARVERIKTERLTDRTVTLRAEAEYAEAKLRLEDAQAELRRREDERRMAARAVSWSERFPPPGELGHLATRDPTLMRIAEDARKEAHDGVVYESPAAAVTLKESTRWSAYAKPSGITDELLALFEPGREGDRPVEPAVTVDPSKKPSH